MSDTRRAAKAFEDFSGHKPSKVRRSRLDDRDVAGWEMGPLIGVAYEAKRDGKRERYFHEFKKSARPKLIAKDDGSRLYIDGGRYKVTDRGIEDMPALFVVNPSPRKGKARMAKRRRKTARRATIVVRANPKRRRRTTRRAYARNPAPRRRTVRRMRRNPIRRARRAMGASLNFGKWVLPAAGIGLGAVGADIITGYLPIPAGFKSGVMRHVTKGAVAIAAGMLIGKVLRQKRIGNAIALGGVAIAVHDAAKEMISARLPGVPFGMYVDDAGGSLGYYSPASILPGSMGEYVAPVRGSLGGYDASNITPEFAA